MTPTERALLGEPRCRKCGVFLRLCDYSEIRSPEGTATWHCPRCLEIYSVGEGSDTEMRAWNGPCSYHAAYLLGEGIDGKPCWGVSDRRQDKKQVRKHLRGLRANMKIDARLQRKRSKREKARGKSDRKQDRRLDRRYRRNMREERRRALRGRIVEVARQTRRATRRAGGTTAYHNRNGRRAPR